METNLLFMDECYCSKTDIASLTGILIPTSNYNEIRNSFYDIINWHIEPKQNTVELRVLELHGSDFLKDESDEKKLFIYNKLVELINTNKVKIYRIGIYETKRVRTIIDNDDKLLELLFSDILFMLQSYLANNLVIPIMDGLDKNFVKLSRHIRNIDIIRKLHENGLSIKNTSNILGEVFYADSQYSIFIQLADTISYLRHCVDLFNQNIQLSPFKKKLYELANLIDRDLLKEEITTIEMIK